MLYFLRHGETDANLNKISAGGELDIPINNNGIEQAKRFSDNNKELISSIDEVYVSPMIRAQQTMEIALEGHDKPITIVENLRELVLGDWSKMSHDTVPKYLEEELDTPNGETWNNFEYRCIKAIKDISDQNKNKKTLIVSHGAVWYTYANRANHKILYIENCGVLEVCKQSLNNIEVTKI